MSKGIVSNRGGTVIERVAGGANVVKDEATGITGIIITFPVGHYTYGAAGATFYRNGLLMDKVAAFAGGTGNAEEYQEVNLGSVSNQITLNPTDPSVATERFEMVFMEGVSSGESAIEETQASHGFAVLDAIYHNGTTWQKALADDAATVAQYIITEVPDSDNFVAYMFGMVTVASHGKSVGGHYFLSDTVAGSSTLVEPSSGFSCPTFYVKDANTLVIEVYRARDLSITGGGVGSADTLFVDNAEDGTLDDFTVDGVTITQTDTIHGDNTYLITHDAAVDKYFKKVFDVPPKFRNKNCTIEVDLNSDADSNNITLTVKDEITGLILVDAEHAYPVDDINKATKQKFTFDMPQTTSASYQFTGLPDTGKFSRLDDITLKLTPDDPAGIVLQASADSMIRLSTDNGTGSAYTKIKRFSVLEESMGSAITYEDSSTEGASFTVEEDGVYDVTYSESTSSGNIWITKNTTNFTGSQTAELTATRLAVSGVIGANAVGGVSWSGYLLKGDTVRAHTDNNGGGTANQTNFTIAKTGSVQQFPVTTNRKVEMPTSEIRMIGVTGKGTGAEAQTAHYTNIVKNTGSAIAINNSNGTVVNILKDGIVDFTACLAVTGGTLYVTKNCSNPATTPIASETMTALGAAPANERQSISWAGSVKAGDVLRIATNVGFLSESFSGCTILHQETEVGVNINTVVPQYEDTDSMVQLKGGNGRGSSWLTTRRFQSLLKNLGNAITYTDSVADGATFTVKESGVYSIAYSEGSFSTAAVDFHIAVNRVSMTSDSEALDTVASGSIGAEGGEYRNTISWTGFLNAEDIVRPICGAGPQEGNNVTVFTITKQALPSVVGIDGRPIDAYQQKADSEIRVNYATGYGSAATRVFTFQNISSSLGSAIAYHQDAVDGDYFEILEEGMFDATFTSRHSGTAINGISLNASLLTTNIYELDTSERLTMTELVSGARESCSIQKHLLKGDIIRAHGNAAAIGTQPHQFDFTITKIGSLIRSIPLIDSTVDIPMSNIFMESASSRGTGTEATTVKFNNLSEISGDALSYDNSNGTIVTAEEDGEVSVDTTVYISAASTNWAQITLNSSDPSTQIWEPVKAACRVGNIGGAANGQSMSATFRVKKGDKIRVTLAQDPPANVVHRLGITHRKTEVAVAISNVQPQFEDVDTCIRLNKGYGYGSTNNKIRRFASLLENRGSAVTYIDSATDGASFTINEDGIYHITFSDISNTTLYYWIGMSKNSNQLTTGIHDCNGEDILSADLATNTTAGHGTQSSFSGYLKKGDVIRPHVGAAIGQESYGTTGFVIAKQALPSIAEVDVTPFVDLVNNKMLTETITYTGYMGITSSYVKYKTAQTDTGSKLISHDNSTDRTIYTFLEGANFTASASLNNADGTNRYLKIELRDSGNNLVYSSNGYGFEDRSISLVGYANAGNTLTVYANHVGTVYDTLATSFSLVAQKQEEEYSTVYAVEDNENIFSARIEQTISDATVTSSNINFIDYVERVDLGITDIHFKPGFFTEIPSIVGSADSDDARYMSFAQLSTNKVRAVYRNNAGTLYDKTFGITLTRQGADYKDLQRQIVQLKEFPKVNSQLTQTMQHVAHATTIWNSSAEVRLDPNLITYNGSTIVVAEDDAANGRTKFVATRKCSVDFSWSAWDASPSIPKIYKNGVIIMQGTQAYTATASIGASISLDLLEGDYLSFGSSTISTSSSASNIVYVSLNARTQELKQVGNLAGGENVFSAKIANDGTASVISSSYDFISSVTRVGPGNVRVDFKPGFFMKDPSVVTVSSGGGAYYATEVYGEDITGFNNLSHRTTDGNSTDRNFDVIIQRQGDDYRDAQESIIELTDFPRVNRVHHEAITYTKFGGRNADVVTFQDKIKDTSGILIEDTILNGGTAYRALKKCNAVATVSYYNIDTTFRLVWKNSSGTSLQEAYSRSDNHGMENASLTGEMDVGDYIIVYFYADSQDVTATNFSITAVGNDLERITNVDKAENVFSAKIANNGTATIASQSADFIDSVTRTTTGNVTVQFKPGFFTETPIVTALVDVGSSLARTIHYSAATASSVHFRTYNLNDGIGATGYFDEPFSIMVQRQGTDYKSIQDIVVAIPEKKVTYLKDVKSGVQVGGSATAMAWNKRTLNTINGDTSGVTLNSSTSEFTLQAGTYDITASAPCYKSSDTTLRLKNNTDGTNAIVGSTDQINATDGFGNSIIMGRVMITEAKTFELQHWITGNSAGTEVLGRASQPAASVDSIFAEIKIEKVK